MAEKEQNIKTFQTTIRILGQFLPSETGHNVLPQISLDCCMRSYLPQSKDGQVNPIKIAAEGNTLAFTDANHNVWIVNQQFTKPVNLSTLIHRRCKVFALNEKEIIIQSKKQHLLLNWGAKKLLDNKLLTQIPISNKSSYQCVFKNYQITTADQSHYFHFSNIKKVDNTNKLYHIKVDQQNKRTEVDGLPSLQRFSVPFKIRGVSIGKYHCLCWDDQGQIYSWGNRTIALGYEDLPLESHVTTPRRLAGLKCRVTSAFAANNYSLALCVEGTIYQWGIKKDVNGINDELIFQPQPLKLKKNTKQNLKYICLKGKGENFAAVSTVGGFYIWGISCRQFLEKGQTRASNLRIYQPTQVEALKQFKIVDYAIEERYIAVITAAKDMTFMMDEERCYWNQMLTTVKKKWLCKSKRLKTENNPQLCSQKQNLRFSQSVGKSFRKARQHKISLSQNLASFSMLNSKMTEDKVQTQYYHNKIKKNYLSMAKSESTLFQYIMNQPENAQKVSTLTGPRIRIKQGRRKPRFPMLPSSQADGEKQQNQNTCHLSPTLRHSEGQDSQLTKVNQTLVQVRNFISKNTINVRSNQQKKLTALLSERTPETVFIKKNIIKPYKVRLSEAKQKKKHLQYQVFHQVVRKVEQNSLQYRQKRKDEVQRRNLITKQRQLLKNTLYSFLAKNMLVQGLCHPLSEARRLKIENFGLTLKLQRKQKLIRKLFAKSRAKSSIKELQKLSFKTFMTLCHVFKRYIARKRKQKYQKMRKIVVNEILKSILKQKIRLGLARIHLNVRKLQKFNQWLKMVKKERVRCLKIKWKSLLMSSLKTHNEDHSSSAVSKADEISFKALYMERTVQNPSLKLRNFLNKKAIFSLKFEYFQKIVDLFSDRDSGVLKSERIINTLKTMSGTIKRPRIRFSDEDEDKEKPQGISPTGYFQHQADILPYSLHMNMFVKPAMYDLSMPETLRTSEKWVKEQKMILEKCLEGIIQQHEATYLEKRTEYDLALAEYIKSRYEKISETRWKTIIQYNQLKRTHSKVRKQKQLRRLLQLVGGAHLMKQDCLPEQHLVLDEASKRPDAPRAPNSWIVLGHSQFKKAFKKYYEMVHTRLKYLKKHG